MRGYRAQPIVPRNQSRRSMNRSFAWNSSAGSNSPIWPACVGVDEEARIFGWPPFSIPVLFRLSHFKPMSRPQHNARKWFATWELEQLGQDLLAKRGKRRFATYFAMGRIIGNSKR
jgi:hypothetical protein